MTTSVYQAYREVTEAKRKLAEAKVQLKIARGNTPMSSETKFFAIVVGVVVGLVAVAFVSEIIDPYN